MNSLMPRRRALRRTVFLLVFLALALSARVHAQLPALEAAPRVLAPRQTLVLSLPAGAVLPAKVRVGLYEKNRPTRLDDEKKTFSSLGGRWSTQLQIEADPGLYELRVLSDDKNRTLLSQPVEILVPGLRREAGWWLLNGSPFAREEPASLSSLSPESPLFVPGLKRDGKARPPRNIFASGGALRWRVLRVPDAAKLLAPDFNFNEFRAQLSQEISAARARGERNLLGISLRAPTLGDGDEAKTASVGRRVREAINELAPDAALILEIPQNGYDSMARGVDAWAAFIDAVAIERDFQNGKVASLWPVKASRRIAEEQPRFDLPIFVIGDEENSQKNAAADARVLDALMNGATGIVTVAEYSPNWRATVERNAALFIGAATLEDIGLLPTPDVPNVTEIEELFGTLRESGRLPLLARLQRKEKGKFPESFLALLSTHITPATVERLRLSLEDGARIYLEGAPVHDTNEKPAWQLSGIVGASAKPVPKKSATMMLDDFWLFGTLNGARIPVEQTVAVTLDPPSGKTIKTEKGKDILTVGRVVARLEDGSPALVLNPVGDGEVLWSPHRLLDATGRDGESVTKFYNAVAAHYQPSLLQLRAPEGKSTPDGKSTPAVHTAVRRSPQGTWIIGLFNTSDQSASLSLEANQFAEVALDLKEEKALPLMTRGNRSFVTTTVPAGGWQLIALGQSREELDKERFAPRAKAKFR